MALPSSPPLISEPDLPSSPPSLCISQQNLSIGPRRKRQHSDYGGFSSDPLFSDTTSDAEQYGDGDQPKRKRVVRGPWWSLGNKSGQSLRRNMMKESFRNADSGVWMGSDEHEASSDNVPSSQQTMRTLVMSDTSEEKTPIAKKPLDAEGMAARIVNTCLDECQQTVDLSDLGLTKLSNSTLRPLHQLIRSTHVDLTQPPSEDEFRPLTPSIQLFLSRNCLELLPAELFALNNITVLSLRANRLEKLPAAISRLSNLKELNIAGNAIRHLPWELLEMMRCSKVERTISLRPNPFIEPIDLSGPWSEPQQEEDDNMSVDADDDAQKDETNIAIDIRAELERRMRSGRQLRLEYLGTNGLEQKDEQLCREELIYLASSTIQYFGITGMPMGRSHNQSEDYFAAVMEPTIDAPPAEDVTPVPSLFELALRSLQSKYDLQDAAISMSDYVPTTVAAALRKAGRNAGEYGNNETCSTCGREFVIARAEWMEYWFNGLPSQECLTQETVVPFLRKSCSWACAKPSEVGEFRA